MNVKLTGILLILLCGVYVAFLIKAGFDKRIRSLKSFLDDLEFFLSNISFLKTPVCEIIKKLSENKTEEFGEFYAAVYKYYCVWDEKILKEAVDSDKLGLKNKDKELICDFFKSFGDRDYENQLNYLKLKTSEIRKSILEAEENKKKNQKPGYTFAFCLFLFVIILFI